MSGNYFKGAVDFLRISRGTLDSGQDSLIETSVSNLLVQEGSTTNFTVWLNTQSLGRVTVNVARVEGDTNIIVQSGGVFTDLHLYIEI